ncbi:PREDICTED: putative F-box protein At5g66830 [Camelina sativa]|uniref:F-box protein At5g66830 n=1 Tax=Camelina sativa TaxID=90675 RepID=A0ABM0UD19_CAMSA|nr:PREDICTED: putative F-box protein At5g66830 [Camelina sativa]
MASPPAPDPAVSNYTTAVHRSCPKRNRHCWSNLPPDLLQIVFERLGFTDFKRAKSVCTSWESASRKSQPKNQIPWLILFPKDNNYGLLFNPEEQGKLYKTQDLGDDFAKSFCVGAYRSWLLMLDPQYRDCANPLYNLYILDLLTRERSTLPTLESEFGLIPPVFWVDEKTKDYLVIGMFDEENVVSFKKGDNSWKQVHELSGIGECFNIVYKDHKLYCLGYCKLKIFDFSTDKPVKVFKISVRGYILILLRCPGRMPQNIPLTRMKNNVVVTLSGDVLIVTSIRQGGSKIWNFEIYKMDSSKGNKWEQKFSIGNEAILLDLGITVLAEDIGGIKKNSIYFNATDYDDQHDENDVFIFSLDTKKVEQPHQSVCSSVPGSNARWFLPSFKRE